MKMQNLHDLFIEEVRELYDGEKQLVKALPKMANAALSPHLRAAFESHVRETEEHIERLEQILIQLKEIMASHSCEAIKGLIKEGDKIANSMDESPLRDAGLIGAADRIKRYEMTAYTAARTFAEMLGYTEAARLLDQTFQEERQLDRKLTELEITELAELMICESALQSQPQAGLVSAPLSVAV